MQTTLLYFPYPTRFAKMAYWLSYCLLFLVKCINQNLKLFRFSNTEKCRTDYPVSCILIQKAAHNIMAALKNNYKHSTLGNKNLGKSFQPCSWIAWIIGYLSFNFCRIDLFQITAGNHMVLVRDKLCRIENHMENAVLDANAGKDRFYWIGKYCKPSMQSIRIPSTSYTYCR